MRKSLLVLIGAALATSLSLTAVARGPGGGGMGLGAGVGGSLDRAGAALSGSAAANSNGRVSQDRDKGLDRAQDRMSQEGLQHEKATDVQKKRNRPSPQGASGR